MSNDNFYKNLIEVFKVLSISSKLKSFDNGVVKVCNGLFKLSQDGIELPISTTELTIFKEPSPLKDSPIDIDSLTQILIILHEFGSIIRLNHVAICYPVVSQEDEREFLTKEIAKTKFHLYEEESNDYAKWYFVGDTSKWDDPLVEFLPVVRNTDKWIDYWLPHIHIDIDTNQSEGEIENLINGIYRGSVKPFRVTVINNIVYTIRFWLGVIDGINIYLDISTKNRQVKYFREKILKQIA